MAFELLAVFATAFAISAAIVPPIRRVAVFRRLLDYPDQERRTHKRAVPRLGGVAVFIALVIAAVLATLYESRISEAQGSFAHVFQLLGACAILVGVGLADDLRGVPPLGKIGAQVAAAVIVQYDWPQLTTIQLPPHFTLHLGIWGVPIFTLWLVGVSNALNLVDGLDGLAAGVAMIGLAAAIGSALLLHETTTPWMTAALAGAIFGFLIYNFPPASIFLGDSGSLPIGFLLAFLCARRATDVEGVTRAIVPIFALAYPLLDTATSMMRRWLRGHPLSRADGRHIHHQLVAIGLSDRNAVGVIYAVSLGVAALGLTVTFARPEFTATLLALAVLVIVGGACYGVYWLGYHEFIDAGLVLRAAGSRAKGAIRAAIYARDVAGMIGNAKSLEEIDEILMEHASTFQFAHMEIGCCDARLPSHIDGVSHGLWKLEYPVLVPETNGFRAAGRLEDSLVLSIWCRKNSAAQPASAERVAAVLSDAVANWTAVRAGAINGEIQARARVTPADPHIDVALSIKTAKRDEVA